VTGYVGCTLEPVVGEANFWPIGWPQGREWRFGAAPV